MELKETPQEIKKNEKKFVCQICCFECNHKCDWDRHVLRKKHAAKFQENIQDPKKNEKNENQFLCHICDRSFKTNAGLWKHNNRGACSTFFCNEVQQTPISLMDKDELIIELLKQNKELLEIVKNGTNNTNCNNNTNSHNKAFNLNFFLNETCKNAMNISEFVESIKLQLSDLTDVGELGYVDGISKIIAKNLNNLDETIRPIHCTDRKRETFYVKDQNQWEKEDDNKTKLKRFVQSIANKNIRLLPQFREKHPDYSNSSLKISDVYDKIVVEAMVCDKDKDEKIIKNICHATTIHKLI